MRASGDVEDCDDAEAGSGGDVLKEGYEGVGERKGVGPDAVRQVIVYLHKSQPQTRVHLLTVTFRQLHYV